MQKRERSEISAGCLRFASSTIYTYGMFFCPFFFSFFWVSGGIFLCVYESNCRQETKRKLENMSPADIWRHNHLQWHQKQLRRAATAANSWLWNGFNWQIPCVVSKLGLISPSQSQEVDLAVERITHGISQSLQMPLSARQWLDHFVCFSLHRPLHVTHHEIHEDLCFHSETEKASFRQ